MRRDEEAVDLLVGVVGQREHDPVGTRAGLARLDGDAPHDAVAARRRRDLDDVAVGAVALDRRRQIDRRGVRLTRTASTACAVDGKSEKGERREERRTARWTIRNAWFSRPHIKKVRDGSTQVVSIGQA